MGEGFESYVGGEPAGLASGHWNGPKVSGIGERNLGAVGCGETQQAGLFAGAREHCAHGCHNGDKQDFLHNGKIIFAKIRLFD